MNVYYPITELTQLADELSLIADRIEERDGLLFQYRLLVRAVGRAARLGSIPEEISFYSPTEKEEYGERHYGWHKNYHRPGST